MNRCAVALLIVASLAGKAAAEELRSKVVAITDGDTLKVLDEANVQHRIRLEGIDSPEKKQAYSAKAGEALGEKVFQKEVRVEWRSKDRYGRILGHIYLGDRWINKEMVEEGWAWHFKRYSRDPDLAQAEVKAKAAGVGLWADKEPTPPWQFRAAAKAGVTK